jgi:hypothetical protein
VPTDTTAGYCATHDCHHPKLERCPQCRAARNSIIKVASPKADTTELRILAATARLREAACWNEFKRYSSPDLESDTPTEIDPHIAVKFSAETVKHARLAMEIESKVAELEHDQWLIEQDRARGGDN